jgi:GTPase
MFEYLDKILPKQKKESHNGNREYKMYLDLERERNTEIKKSRNIPKKELNYLRKEKLIAKINKRASQLRYRLEEGHGKAIYIIGIRDDGTVEGIEIELLFKSLNFLYKMVEIINAIIKNIRIYKSNNQNKFIFTARIEIPNYTPKQLVII